MDKEKKSDWVIFKKYWVIILMFIVIVSSAAVTLLEDDPGIQQILVNVVLGLGIFLLFVEIVKVTNALSKRSTHKKPVYQDLLENMVLEKRIWDSDARSPEDEKETLENNILVLMLKNSVETGEYFEISKRQAKGSYLISVVVSIKGVVLLVAAVVMVFWLRKFNVAIIAMVAGAVTEVIAGTVLWIHNKSLKQLNYYYKALHENEKFLSAVTLVERVSEGRRDDVYIEIVRSQFATRIEDEEEGDDTAHEKA